MLPLLVLLGTIAGAWYLLIVRPQKDQQTRHGRLVDQLQVGDHVLTVGGIYGRVAALEGSSAVLELAPGLTSRIATNGIARIVHGGEAAPATPIEPPRQTLDIDMHQPPQDQQQLAPQPVTPQFPAPSYVAPQQPYVMQQQRVHHPLPSFEPRPWGDVAPINTQHHAAAPMPHAAPIQHAAPLQHAPLQHAPLSSALPLHAPFAPVAPVVQQVRLAQQIPQPVAPQPAALQMPPQVMPVAPCTAQPDAVSTEQAQANHSRAPEGMGSRLRLDDPSLRDSMERARHERAGLAVEYRKLTAPLVDVGDTTSQLQQHAIEPASQDAVLVGHDPNGVPLFASLGAPLAHPVAPQYPAPARVDGAAAMPRPVVQAPAGPTDPALTTSAFQRRTPYAPDPALTVATAPVPAQAHAHA